MNFEETRRLRVSIYNEGWLFQFRSDHKFLCVGIPVDSEHVRFAADLAIFYVTLFRSITRIDEGFVPFAAPCALEP